MLMIVTVSYKKTLFIARIHIFNCLADIMEVNTRFPASVAIISRCANAKFGTSPDMPEPASCGAIDLKPRTPL